MTHLDLKKKTKVGFINIYSGKIYFPKVALRFFFGKQILHLKTRMHSSTMRTARFTPPYPIACWDTHPLFIAPLHAGIYPSASLYGGIHTNPLCLSHCMLGYTPPHPLPVPLYAGIQLPSL